MGWFENLWRRRQGSATDDKEQMVRAREKQRADSETDVADELEEEAHAARDEQVMREPRIPPGTG